MKIVFWGSLLGVLYTYIGYPMIIWIMSRLRPQPWNAAPIAPTVSIVLAVHNGAPLLPRKIEHLLNLDYQNIKEIILVSDGSTDATEAILRSQKCDRLKVIVLHEHGGKARAVNAGIAAATAEVILFIDIRPEAAPGAIAALVSNFADPSVGCVSGRLLLLDENHDAASAAVGGLYWRYEQWIRGCEALYDSPVGVYGGFYAIRRELATLQPEGIILDDMFQPLSIIRQGYRSVVDDGALVYDVWPKKVSGEFHRKVRTLAGNFQLMQLAPWTMTFSNRVLFQLVCHKLSRLMVPYLMGLLLLAGMVLSTASWFYAGVLTAQVSCLLLALIGLMGAPSLLHRIAAPASALLVLNMAAVVGLGKFLFTRGPLWKIWNAGPSLSAPTEVREEELSPETAGAAR